MSPTPVTFTLPAQPASYSWEATDEEVAARYGVDPADIVRFDLNTSPVPPDLAGRILAQSTARRPDHAVSLDGVNRVSEEVLKLARTRGDAWRTIA